MRRWFPRRYFRSGLARARRDNARDLIAAKHRTAQERYELRQFMDSSLEDWRGALLEIDDRRLVAKATKMDIDLDDFSAPEEGERYIGLDGHFQTDAFGNQYLVEETRKALKARMRERAPAYRKERRERWELIIKILTVIAGLIGTATGLVSAISWLHK
jgi:hypothetical protein